MTNETGAGAIIGGLAFVFGFAMVWEIWWLAIAAGAGIWSVLIMRIFNDRDFHVIPACEVERMEGSHPAAAGRCRYADVPLKPSRV